MKAINLLALCTLVALYSCHKYSSRYGMSDLSPVPPKPDYSQNSSWAALPTTKDQADRTPNGVKEYQSRAEVDVFYVHPTIYTKKQQPANPWNADLRDKELNESVDESAILNQASVFNGSAKVYAPRYRQAHIKVFRIGNPPLKNRALDIAYEDVKEAFLYYLKNYKNGRPFIIAGHSQGTIHAARLIREFVDGDPDLKKDFIAGYLVGIALQPDIFQTILPCESPNETECWVSWNTFRYGYYPSNYVAENYGTVSTNPLTWSAEKPVATIEENPGSVLWKFEETRPEVCDAVVENGLLWIHKPQFPGSFLNTWKVYHVADYNLFYLSIRQNVEERVDAYLKSSKAVNRESLE